MFIHMLQVTFLNGHVSRSAGQDFSVGDFYNDTYLPFAREIVAHRENGKPIGIHKIYFYFSNGLNKGEVNLENMGAGVREIAVEFNSTCIHNYKDSITFQVLNPDLSINAIVSDLLDFVQ